jgi:predicted ester cyclase
MSTEDADATAVVRRFFATLDAQDLGTLEREIMASDYRLHFDGLPEMDAAAASGFFGAFLAAFPDISHSVEDIFAERDRVACRLIVRGTQTGEFMGIPATNRPVEIHALNVHHIVRGRTAEHWINSDGLGMLMQLGVIPSPNQG